MSQRRWMLFIDGENFAIRGQDLALAHGIGLETGQHHEPNVFLWMPRVPVAAFKNYCTSDPSDDYTWRAQLEDLAVRAYYYTALVGDDQEQRRVSEALRALGFTPSVFKKLRRSGKAKGVDITLTKDVLSHGFLDHYDACFLVAGDGDYTPLVKEVKRLGKIVYVAFFEGDNDAGLSPELRLEADLFLSLNPSFLAAWRGG